MTNPLSIRTFFAVALPEALRQQLSGAQEKLATLVEPDHLRIAWVEPASMHITLRFLGETPTDLLRGLRAAAEKASHKREAFTVTLLGGGFFPSATKPRVLHVKAQSEALTALSVALDRALEGSGVAPRDHPFAPHITLGRVKSGEVAPRLTAQMMQLGMTGEFEVREFVLYRSETLPTGPVYTPLLRAPLRLP